MKLFTSYLVVVAFAVAAFASVAQANSNSAVQALQIRGQGMNALCDSPTLSREGFVAVCGTKGASQHPTRAVLRAYAIRGAGMNALVVSATAPDVRALQIRGEGMNAMCQSPTLSREGFVAVCGTQGASQQPTRAVLRAYAIRGAALNALPVSRPISTPDTRALQIRGEGMNALCSSPTLSRESYIAVCGTEGASQQPTRAELQAMQIRGEAMDHITAVPVSTISSNGFDWSDFGIGAISMLGLVLLAGGITAGVHYSRRHTVRPRPVS
ncbi:MAG TPA: hypothetical protein VFU10_04500 [Gaiellaceae bacterium]|nr:hypothetical protein [Gaiellaceae bacterium]